MTNDPIESAVTTVATPNEKVFAEVRAEREVRIWFAPGFYDVASTTEMERNLTNVARLLWAAARKDHLAILSAATGQAVSGTFTPLARQDVDYYDRLAALEAEGVADDGSVRVSAVGQQNYVVSVAPGVLTRTPEASFAAACGQAADRLIADTEQQAARARWEVYLGTPLPG